MPNLVPLPSNAFSGEAVKFDNAPVDKALLQNTYAKQQATQLALNKYFDKQANQLTPVGMDMQNDGQGFIDRKNAWQDFALQNRRAILNPSMDGGRAATQSNALFNEAKSFAQKSVQKVKTSQEAAKVLLDPTKSALLTDHARDMIHHGTLGLDDPSYVPMDLTSAAFNPKPWGTQDEAGLSHEVAGYKGSQKDALPVQDAKSGTQTVRTDTNFGKDDLIGMYGAGSSRYYSNPGFKVMIDAIPKTNPIQFQDLNSLFKTHYGRDVQTGEDLAAAYAISKNPNARSTEKTSPIPGFSDIAQGKKLQVAGVNAGIQLNKEEKLHDYDNAHPSPSATPQADTEGLLQTLESNAQKGQLIENTIGGKKSTGYSVELAPKLANIFSVTHNGHKEPPDRIVFDPATKNYTGLWYEKNNGDLAGSNGNYAVSQSLPPKTLSRDVIKQELNQSLLPKKQAGAALPKPSGKPAVSAEDVKKKYGINY